MLGFHFGGVEGAIFCALTVLLFGRSLPELGRHLGRLIVQRRFRHEAT
jgi:hypothetical protein